MAIPPFSKRFFALHCCEGVAFYPENPVGQQMLLIREETLRKMDPTASGKPVKFGGDHLTLKEGEEITKSPNKGALAEGVINKSFFNDSDGRHWMEILVWDKDALAAIERGIGVSNAYAINAKAPGADYHALPFDFEVMEGEYDHLLITDSPRYEESKILTPEQFKAYNETRAEALALVTNSKESTMSFKLFGRKPVEGLSDLTGVEVELPKSKKTVLITNALNAIDEQMQKEEAGNMFANEDHKVKLSENESCNVSELKERYNKAMEENSRMKNELDEWDKASGDGKEKDDKAANETPEEKATREAKEAKNAQDEKDAKEVKEKAENSKRESIRNKVIRLKGGPDRLANSEAFSESNPQPEVVLTSARVRVPESQKK